MIDFRCLRRVVVLLKPFWLLAVCCLLMGRKAKVHAGRMLTKVRQPGHIMNAGTTNTLSHRRGISRETNGGFRSHFKDICDTFTRYKDQVCNVVHSQPSQNPIAIIDHQSLHNIHRYIIYQGTCALSSSVSASATMLVLSLTAVYMSTS